MLEGVCNTAQTKYNTHEQRRTGCHVVYVLSGPLRGRVGCDDAGFASRAVVLAMIASSSLSSLVGDSLSQFCAESVCWSASLSVIGGDVTMGRKLLGQVSYHVNVCQYCSKPIAAMSGIPFLMANGSWLLSVDHNWDREHMRV